MKLCTQNGQSNGAHPGFADLQGFGRRVINLTVKELEANIAYQIGALQAIAQVIASFFWSGASGMTLPIQISLA